MHKFQHSFGQGGPRWEATSFEQAAGLAQRRFKFLLAYLHSPNHQVHPASSTPHSSSAQLTTT